MKTTTRKPLEFNTDSNKPKLTPRENRQKDFLHSLAQGESIHDTCALVVVTRFPFERWRSREKEARFSAAAVRWPRDGNPSE